MSIRSDLMTMLNAYEKDFRPSLFKDKEIYAAWLAQTYFFVCHSTPLLGYAMPHLKNADLRHHFENHLGEEKRHDLVALKDIERLGKDISQFEELNITKAFYHSQYYRISFEHGTSLLGYILLLEGLAVTWGKSIYEEVKDVHKNSCLFLKVHAEEDPHHLEGAIETIMKLSPEEQKCIMDNLRFTDEIYKSMLMKVMASRSLKVAA